jgi:hypothetical protein
MSGGARYEITIDGVGRTNRDTKEIAIEAAKVLMAANASHKAIRASLLPDRSPTILRTQQTTIASFKNFANMVGSLPVGLGRRNRRVQALSSNACIRRPARPSAP